jgi:hypothetical protein
VFNIGAFCSEWYLSEMLRVPMAQLLRPIIDYFISITAKRRVPGPDATIPHFLKWEKQPLGW